MLLRLGVWRLTPLGLPRPSARPRTTSSSRCRDCAPARPLETDNPRLHRLRRAAGRQPGRWPTRSCGASAPTTSAASSKPEPRAPLPSRRGCRETSSDMDADIFAPPLRARISPGGCRPRCRRRPSTALRPPRNKVARGADEAAITPPAPAGPVEWNPHLRPGDISPADYQRLSMAQIDELERISPGIGERIDAASRWAAESELIRPSPPRRPRRLSMTAATAPIPPSPPPSWRNTRGPSWSSDGGAPASRSGSSWPLRLG